MLQSLRAFFVPRRVVAVALALGGATVALADGPTTPYPILFVTQVPIPGDFTSIGSVFGNHRASMETVGRGGDLWIRYTDGTLRNLTAAAGYGVATGLQGAGAIAVREPCVHWSGQKAVFSMVVGGARQQYDYTAFRWQIYEITGLGQAQTPVITRVANQPAAFNNISPIYGTDDAIIFTSDRPRTGEAHLYPQLDEYEEAPTVTGLWRIAPNGTLLMLNHAPSGDFSPIIDSFGRVLFTQWDHLQRDQQADADSDTPPGEQSPYGTFNWTSEAASSTPMFNNRDEIFPEPRAARPDLLAGTNLVGHSFNHFFVWQMNEDGSDMEIINHLGRHELHAYVPASINDDSNVFDYYGQLSRFNPNPINNMLQAKEDPTTPGRYYFIDAPEFQTHACGQLARIDAPPTVDADHVAVTYMTHRDTSQPDDAPAATHTGLYRDPLVLSDGTIIVSHTAETRADTNTGTRANPGSRYDLRLKTLAPLGNGLWGPGVAITPVISKTVTYYDPDVLVSYSGPLWQWQAVEVRPRTRPQMRTTPLPSVESQVLSQAGVNETALRDYLRANNLALIVSRNVTTRDDFDLQQPFNLRVAGGGAQTIGRPGRIYDVEHLQIFQGDQLRSRSYNNDPSDGRRVLAQYLHDTNAVAANIPSGAAPQATVRVASDGSVAAFVPAQRALSWQLLDPAGTPVVRERNWLSFQAGEIRVCTSCHGMSQYDQAGHLPPTNAPLALRELLDHWTGGSGCPQVGCDNGGIDVDFDDDCQVTLTDVALLLANFGTTGAPGRPGDADGNGAVSLNDLSLVLTRFGNNCQ